MRVKGSCICTLNEPMLFLALSLLVVALGAHRIYPAVEVIYFWEHTAARLKQIDHWSYVQQREIITSMATRRIALTAGCVVLALAYLHVYSGQCDTLVAQREAALSQPPPYGCSNGQLWEELSMAQQARIALQIGPSPESACATYLAHIHMSLWPNPILIYALILHTADAVGQGMALVLGPHSILIQAILVLLPAFAALLAVYAGGPLLLLHKLRRMLQQPRKPARKPKQLYIEMPTKSMLVDKEGNTPKHIP